MPMTLSSGHGGRLERSCKRSLDSIRFGPRTHGLERAEVYLTTRGFEPHRHDTYGIGLTTHGVQTFRYRGARRVCLPGQLHILHPDETHDGAPASDGGFGYRILYIAPQLVREAIGSGDLPFVANPVQEATLAARPMAMLLADIDEPLSELSCADVAATIADSLLALSGRPAGRPTPIDLRAVQAVRDYLAANPREQTPASVLEAIAGVDRFTIARHFRRALGTSPDRYRARRRLDLARAAIESGRSLAQAASESGFADQSHMTRHFKKTYGVTPGRWMTLTSAEPLPTLDPSAPSRT